MDNTAILRLVNPLLAVGVLVQAVTGIGMWLFEWDAVHDVHVASGMVLLVLASVHLILNRRWVRVAYRRRGKVSPPRT
jgi:hypothetical protein